MRGSSAAITAAVVLISIVGVIAIGLASSGSPGRTGPVSAPSGTPAAAVDSASGLPTIARSALPPEARTTLALIAAGGPFPFAADGSTFQNRERLLPSRPAGTYREYTVKTPGSPDRGARRIVMASTDELYWSADHYASFARILP